MECVGQRVAWFTLGFKMNSCKHRCEGIPGDPEDTVAPVTQPVQGGTVAPFIPPRLLHKAYGHGMGVIVVPLISQQQRWYQSRMDACVKTGEPAGRDASFAFVCGFIQHANSMWPCANVFLLFGRIYLNVSRKSGHSRCIVHTLC